MSAVRQILDAIHALPRGDQKLILQELTEELGPANEGVPFIAANDQGSTLGRFEGLAGTLSAEDAKLMERAAKDFERIDPSVW